jgi:4-hydroxyphenylpyruvate dioxygenase
LPLRAFDFVEIVTGGARQTAYFLRAAFGFQLTAYRGPETGHEGAASYVLQQGRIRLVVTEGRGGDRVRTIGLTVENARECYGTALARGALAVAAPISAQDALGLSTIASIGSSEGLVYSFVERAAYRGAFLPGYEPGPPTDSAARPVGLVRIESIAFAVAQVGREDWRRFHSGVLGPSPLRFDAIPADTLPCDVRISVAANNAAQATQRLRAQGVEFVSSSITRSILDGETLSFAITQAGATL